MTNSALVMGSPKRQYSELWFSEIMFSFNYHHTCFKAHAKFNPGTVLLDKPLYSYDLRNLFLKIFLYLL